MPRTVPCSIPSPSSLLPSLAVTGSFQRYLRKIAFFLSIFLHIASFFPFREHLLYQIYSQQSTTNRKKNRVGRFPANPFQGESRSFCLIPAEFSLQSHPVILSKLFFQTPRTRAPITPSATGASSPAPAIGRNILQHPSMQEYLPSTCAWLLQALSRACPRPCREPRAGGLKWKRRPGNRPPFRRLIRLIRTNRRLSSCIWCARGGAPSRRPAPRSCRPGSPCRAPGPRG